jgi:hypothetical protein
MASLPHLLDQLTTTSAPSRLNFQVEPLQFDPCLVNRELPIDGPLLLVDAAHTRKFSLDGALALFEDPDFS